MKLREVGPAREGNAIIMLDPSLLLSRRTAQESMQILSEARGRIVVPRTMLRLAESPYDAERLWRFYGIQRREERMDLPASLFGRIAEFAAPESVSPEDEAGTALRWPSWRSPVADVLHEEWAFLNHHSWIVSRIKRPFAYFIKAGAVSVEAGRRAFDQQAARVLRKELGPTGLSTLQRLRAVGKWAAAGGPSALVLLHNAGLGVLLGAAARMFLLYDP